MDKYNPILIGVGSNLLGNVVMFMTTIYLTRTFPTDVYGQFRLIFAFLALAVILFQFGRDNGIIYYAQKASNDSDLDKLIKSEVLFGVIGLALGSGLLYICTPFYGKTVN